MYQEARQAPTCVGHLQIANEEPIHTLVKFLRAHPPQLIVTCGRGSSDHGASFAKYLIETQLGIPTMSMAPSVSSLYVARQNMERVLFLAISQSGQSPDILVAAQAAKAAGAYVVCFVNDVASPLAQLSDTVIPLHAGPEKSVAATKSFICTLSALAQFVAVWQRNDQMLAELATLPEKLDRAADLDWSKAVNALSGAANMFVISRGLGLGIAQEAALKLKETCGLHAEAFSAAEVKHGPMTLVQKNFPVMVFSPQDQTQPSIDDVAQLFIRHEANVLSIGHAYDGALNLPTISCADALLRPIIFIQSFYVFVNALSRARGYNPDQPLHLSKITETL
jgi:glucosamine--fructose-6-phosphate aminotransferase (isomerizing)